MGPFRTLAATGLLAMLLVGCAQSWVASPETQFVEGSPDAIVVIGLKSIVPIITPGSRSYPDFQMAWDLLPAQQPSRPTVPRPLIVDSADRTGIFEDKPPGELALYVIRVPAGTYYLRQITTAVAQSRYTLLPMGAPGAPFFTVKPGEVRYIGDLHCDVIARPARCTTLTRSDALAHAVLGQYPGIRVKPHFRAPAYSPAADEPARVMAVSE